VSNVLAPSAIKIIIVAFGTSKQTLVKPEILISEGILLVFV